MQLDCLLLIARELREGIGQQNRFFALDDPFAG
jgi:hypothetical protein